MEYSLHAAPDDAGFRLAARCNGCAAAIIVLRRRRCWSSREGSAALDIQRLACLADGRRRVHAFRLVPTRLISSPN